jgi:transposase
MSENIPRRKYDTEFKREVVRLILEGKRKATEVARELGIRTNMLYRWKQEYTQDHQEAFRGSGQLTSSEEALRKLVRENEVLKEERDILKKALGIFSVTGR